MSFFSFNRFVGLLIKEFIQILRDRATFAIIFLLPITQLTLFGYAINFDPKDLPTAIVKTPETQLTRSFLQSFKDTGYFRYTHVDVSESEAEQLMRRGDVQFILSIPTDFERSVIRSENPGILLQADATDPATGTPALGAFNELASSSLQHDLKGPLSYAAPKAPPFQAQIHRRYNPENITQYNIVPGLAGVVLTMTMVMVASITLTREFERGTFESLLAMPVRPLEVMLAKIFPFVAIGLIQLTLILASSYFLFHIPVTGSLFLLYLMTILFILANLGVGFTFSTIASNQAQASQLSTFFFLPSLILSGFAFPFRGMPEWAQKIGEIFPLSHFLRIIRGILLKGNTFTEIWPNVWPMIVFMIVMAYIALKRYRVTLD